MESNYERSIEVLPGKLYVSTFTGRQNSSPRRRYIAISDDPEPGLGKWLTVPEAKKLVRALQELIAETFR